MYKHVLNLKTILFNSIVFHFSLEDRTIILIVTVPLSLTFGSFFLFWSIKALSELKEEHNDAQGILIALLAVQVRKGAKIRNRYNQVPHLTQDTNGKVTNSRHHKREPRGQPFPSR